MPGKFGIKDLELLGVSHPNTRSLFESALEESQLLPADYLTIRDLSRAGGFEGDVSIILLLMLLFENLAEGSLCLNLDKENLEIKRARISGGLAISEPEVENSLRKLLAGGLLTKGAGNVQGSPLVLNNNRLYFQKYFTAESAVKSILSNILHAEGSQNYGGKTEPEITAVIGDVCKNMAFGLNSLQLMAVCAGLKQRFLVISGGPGTGKTTTATALLRCLVRLGASPSRIRLAAPTGRAANRLSESIRSQLLEIKKIEGELGEADTSLLLASDSTTLHSLLKYNPSINGFSYNGANPLSADIILVDEVSMVDVHMMRSLLEAVPVHGRLIFMGDKDQLPSVEEGAVLESLIPGDGEYGFSQALRNIHHSVAEQTGIERLPDNMYKTNKEFFQDKVVILEKGIRNVPEIRDFALEINKQTTGLMHSLPILKGPQFDWPEAGSGALVHIPRAADVKAFKCLLEHWLTTRFYLNEEERSFKEQVKKFESCSADKKEECLNGIFKIIEESRILTVVNQGLEGKNGINMHLSHYLREKTDPRATGKIFSGAPIIITTNSHSNQLYNGDTGIILKRGGEYRAWFRGLQDFRSFAMVSLPGWEAALAITVHKSQGSEYDHILMLLPDQENHRLLNRQIIYTGITRAKKTAALYGTAAALDRAVKNRLLRESGLGDWQSAP